MGCSQAESRMICGHGRAQAWWKASGKQGQHQTRGAALGRCHGGLWVCFVWPGVFQLELEISVRPHFPPSPPSALASDG